MATPGPTLQGPDVCRGEVVRMGPWGEEVGVGPVGHVGRERWEPCDRACKAGRGPGPASGHLSACPPGTQTCGGYRVFGLRKTQLGWAGSKREGTREDPVQVPTNQETLGFLAFRLLAPPRDWGHLLPPLPSTAGLLN